MQLGQQEAPKGQVVWINGERGLWYARRNKPTSFTLRQLSQRSAVTLVKDDLDAIRTAIKEQEVLEAQPRINAGTYDLRRACLPVRRSLDDPRGAGGRVLRGAQGAVPESAQSRGLSLVVCGGSVTKLGRNLEEQKQIESRMLPGAGLQQAAQRRKAPATAGGFLISRERFSGLPGLPKGALDGL
jgi:hypothetical protein